MPQLIINADDFGQAPGICQAVGELHDAGALTSATLMANSAAFDEAVSIAKARPTLGVGCHIVLTDGQPVLPPSQVPSLLGSDGRSLYPTLAGFLRALATGKLRKEEIELEATAQIQKIQQAGINVTHLDTHKHTHLFPNILRPLLKAAKACDVPCMRNPFEPEWSIRNSSASFLRTLGVRTMNTLFHRHFNNTFNGAQQITSTGSIGISTTGRLNASIVTNLLKNMPEGTWELVCHPGHHDAMLESQPTRLKASREIELRALLHVVPRIASINPNIQLTHYGRLASR